MAVAAVIKPGPLTKYLRGRVLVGPLLGAHSSAVAALLGKSHPGVLGGMRQWVDP